MDKIKIFVVAPYEGMKTLISEIEIEQKDISLFFEVGDLSKSNFIKAQIEAIAPDCILARGLMADWLTQNIKFPVIKISLSGYDILSAIRTAQETNRKFAIVGFRNMISGAEIMCSLLQYHTEIIEIYNEKEIKQAVINLKSQGYELIVGGTLAVQTAQRIGLGGIQIISGKESIEAAIAHAVSIHMAYKQKLSEIKLLRSVTENCGYDVLAFDQDEHMISKSDLDETICTSAKALCKQIQKENRRLYVRKEVEDQIITLCGYPLQIDEESYTVFYVKKQSNKYCHYSSIRTFNRTEIKYFLPDIVYIKSKFMSSSISNAEYAAKNNCNTIIKGEIGVESEEFARYIFKNSSIQHDLFVVIDLENLEKDELNAWAKSLPETAFEDGITFFFKNIGKTAKSVTTAFSKLLSGKKCRYMIAFDQVTPSCTLDLFLQDIINADNTITIPLMPIRERTDDIVNLIVLFITTCNVKYGKQVIGLEEDAIQFVKSCQWKKNYIELKTVIARAVKRAEGFYLSKASIECEVKRYEALFVDNGQSVDLTGSLADITKRIISAVLKEEGNNRTQAAKRLQISRSKIWSILKE